FVALLKTGERVDATEAVSLIDCGVGTVRFGSHFHFTALPLDFGIVIEIYAMNSMEMMMGDASWIRYWAVLHCGSLSFWRDSDEQASDKPPLSRIDLTKCTNKKITPAACESSGAKVFVINHLVESSSGLFEEKRLSLSADTEQVCLSWIKTINETLGILRA
ncbi:Anillin-like protein 2, partial [Toxocara canis]